MRCKTILILLVLTISTVTAQEVDPSRKQLFFGLGTTYLSVRDLSSSPLRYSGVGVQAQVGYEWEHQKHVQRVSLSLQHSDLHNSISYGSKMMAYAGSLSYAYLYNLTSSDHVQLRLGGTLESWANLRPNRQRDNNPMSYDAGSSLGLATQFTKRMMLASKPLNVDFSLAVPLMTYLIRPSYGIPYPKSFLQDGVYNPKDEGLASSFLSSGQLVTVDKFLRVQSHVGLTYPVSSRKAVRLGYHWDFYSIPSIREMQLADHSFMVSMLLQLHQ